MHSPMVRGVGTILDAMDVRRPAVAAHCRRVSAYAVQLATQYGLPDDMVETIRVGGLLHDIGKLMIPAHVLAKPGRLSEKQWRMLQSHPDYGCDLAKRLGFDQPVADIVLHHHERSDSSGYPHGLDGSQIPWAVRMVSVMDVFDALTSPRTYREALSIGAARTLLAREAQNRYCPWVVSGLLSLPRTMLDAIAHGELDQYRPDACPGHGVLQMATTPWTAGYLDEPGQLTAW